MDSSSRLLTVVGVETIQVARTAKKAEHITKKDHSKPGYLHMGSPCQVQITDVTVRNLKKAENLTRFVGLKILRFLGFVAAVS